MQLRDHPLMVYNGKKNWPPAWAEKYGDRTLTGEVGRLAHVGANPRWGGKIYLHIVHENIPYIGPLLFDDKTFCSLVAAVLKKNVGRAVKEIGDLDLSFSL